MNEWMNEYDLCFSEFIFDKKLVASTCKKHSEEFRNCEGVKIWLWNHRHVARHYGAQWLCWELRQQTIGVVRSLCTGLKTKKWKNRICSEMLSKEARERYLEQTQLVSGLVQLETMQVFLQVTCSSLRLQHVLTQQMLTVEWKDH